MKDTEEIIERWKQQLGNSDDVSNPAGFIDLTEECDPHGGSALISCKTGGYCCGAPSSCGCSATYTCGC